MTDSERTTGDKAELIAIKYLQSHDYAIIETNYVASKRGEIDIIAKKDGLTVFFEVKYRSGDTYGTAIETFTATKKRRFLFAVHWYCLGKRLAEELTRIDFIAIQKMKTSYQVTHVRGVAMK